MLKDKWTLIILTLKTIWKKHAECSVFIVTGRFSTCN